jgi:hypothetical protein
MHRCSGGARRREFAKHGLKLGCHHTRHALVVALDALGFHNDHDRADQSPANIHGTEENRRPRVAEIVRNDGPAIGIGECVEGLADRVMLVRSHRTLGQVQHIALVIVQRDGVDAHRAEGRTHPLANPVVVVGRTFRSAEGLALLHKSSCREVSAYFYRTAAVVGVMVFAKMRQGGRIDLHCALIDGDTAGMTYRENVCSSCDYTYCRDISG